MDSGSNTSIAKGAFQTDSFALKIIAILGMTADHIGNAFYGQLPLVARCILFAPGGLTFPIMAYLLTVGYQHTRDVRRYALRLAVFALLSTLPFFWVLGNKLNVMFTLLMGLGIIWADDHLKNRAAFAGLLVAAILASHWCDWSYIGVPMILLYHRGKDTAWRTLAPVALVWLMGLSFIIDPLLQGTWQQYWTYFMPSLLYCFVGATATIPLLSAYGGKQGLPLKYFFYAYYPVHIALIGLARGLLFGIWWH